MKLTSGDHIELVTDKSGTAKLIVKECIEGVNATYLRSEAKLTSTELQDLADMLEPFSSTKPA